MKTNEEIEVLLRSIQAVNKFPRYLCYWADGSVTQGDSSSPVLMAASRQEADAAKDMLVGYLTPHGLFYIVWDLEGSYTVVNSHQFAYMGEMVVMGIAPALAEMQRGQIDLIDSSWSCLRRVINPISP